MAKTESNMLPLGTTAADFNLLNTVTNKLLSLNEAKSNIATVIAFICNHCPFVKHILDEFIQCANDYQKKGIHFIAISSNDMVNYPDDAPDKMSQLAKEKSFTFPYLFDETQKVAKAYDAACTPDFYIFNKQLTCVYRGQFDDSRPGNTIPVTGNDLRAALDAILAGKPVDTHQKPSLGCNIKWKV